MRSVVVAGIGQTKFGKFLDRSVRSLAEEALDRCLRDAGLSTERIGVTYFANALSGLITGLSGLLALGVGPNRVLRLCPAAPAHSHSAGASTASRTTTRARAPIRI